MNAQLQTMLQQAIQAFQGGKFDSADLILRRVLQVDSKNLPALHILGLIKAEQSNFKEAVDYLSRASKIHPNDASIQYNLAKALSDSGNDRDALIHHKKTVALAPNNPEAWLNYGKTASNLGRYDDALVWYSNALGLKPDYAEALLNKGATLRDLKRYEQAIACTEQALALNPNLAEAWSNKGSALYDLKHLDEAITHFHQALRLNPNINWVYGSLIHAKMKICRWLGFRDDSKNITNKVLANEKVAIPFMLLAINDDALLHKQAAQIFAQEKYPLNLTLGPLLKFAQKERIRVGYFSADFKHHPVSLLMAELFELHDKNRFETFAFSFGVDDKSPIRSRLSQAFNQFIDVSKMSDLQIAKLARDLDIDIAIDLGGYTADARTGVFAYRVAPIQASYIGYLGTMGAEFIDYIFADKTILPEEMQKFYSEKIIYLPSYQVNDRNRIISDRLFTRQELGLPENGFIFCCFNNNYKILPDTFCGWMRILKAVEGSILYLYAENKWVEENLRNEAEARGIDRTRLIFGRYLPHDEYLARYRVCNLFLDTFPYNAGATASDALWAGLPVLTKAGKSFSSRVAASLLSAIGLLELITNTQEEYEALAVELATNPSKLEDIKLKLDANRLTTPLFDTPHFTKSLEMAYIKINERHRADLQPEHIFID